MTTLKVFQVSDDSGGNTSDPLTSMELAHRWVTENLPYGVQKCRTGSYVILEGTLCPKHKEFVEDNTVCENCL